MADFSTKIHLENDNEYWEQDFNNDNLNKDNISYYLKLYCRLARKKLHNLLPKKSKMSFKKILYITIKEPPFDYITAFNRQYPNKIFKILTPISDINGLKKSEIKFNFFAQNKNLEAELYKLPQNFHNVEIYGLYSESFSNKDLSKFQNLSIFLKAARMCALKLYPDIIHIENLPFFLGAEFENTFPSSIKTFHTITDFYIFETNKLEPFWALINLGEKKDMKKICRDKIIKSCIAKLFNLHNTKKFYQMRECLEFIYKNYPKFRKYIDKCEDIEENIIFNRLNERILKLFPKIVYEQENLYNTITYTLNKTNYWGIISKNYYEEIFKRPEITGKIYPLIEKLKSKSGYISYGIDDSITTQSLYQKFDYKNFRDFRKKNKTYILKEFSLDRIKTNFIDFSLFKNQDHKIIGYLDSFYDAPLIFLKFNNDIFGEGIDIGLNTILTLLEHNRNIQVIINIENGLQSNFIKSWVNFLEKHTNFSGRWVFIDGEISIHQFFASSDIALFPARNNTSSKDHLIAMKYGCIPIVPRSGIYDETVSDIFDDIAYGNGFKTQTTLLVNDDVNEIFTNTVLKALNLYQQNPSSWNLLIKNSLLHDSSWNFKIIDKYNEIYENL